MANVYYNVILVEGNTKDLEMFDRNFRKKHTRFLGYTEKVREDELESIEGKLKKQLKGKRIVDFKISNVLKENPLKDNERYYIYSVVQSIEEVEGYSFTNIIPMAKDDFLSGWRKWRLDNWENMWDNIASLKKSNEGYCYSIESGDGSCHKIVGEMAKLYPGLRFIYKYDDPWALDVGIKQYRKGKLELSIFNDKKENLKFTRNKSDKCMRYTLKNWEGKEGYRSLLQEISDIKFCTCLECGAIFDRYELGLSYENIKFVCEKDCLCIHCGGKEVKGEYGEKITGSEIFLNR